MVPAEYSKALQDKMQLQDRLADSIEIAKEKASKVEQRQTYHPPPHQWSPFSSPHNYGSAPPICASQVPLLLSMDSVPLLLHIAMTMLLHLGGLFPFHIHPAPLKLGQGQVNEGTVGKKKRGTAKKIAEDTGGPSPDEVVKVREDVEKLRPLLDKPDSMAQLVEAKKMAKDSSWNADH
ncbi:hypothetical protein BT69DRAFT_1335142 [Atractiella rhizophila]|nr:hypothetical protein BT69DRAFT_1335142 [Atractiella rhizophila]